MIKTPTVFILGAGASIPYDFPSGTGLVDLICHPNNVPNNLANYQSNGIDRTIAADFMTQLRESGQQSVDAFLEHREDFKDVGKTAIALHLIRCEDHEVLFQKRDWYTSLVTRMHAPLAEFSQNKVSFITFNYDRSLEHYLHTTLMRKFGKSYAEVGEVLRQIPFVHVHGQLGFLPWQNASASTRIYKAEWTAEAINIAAKGIRVISESVDDSPEYQRAWELMVEGAQNLLLRFRLP
jgi:hypothetical protein